MKLEFRNLISWKAPAALAIAWLSVLSLPAQAQEEEEMQLSDTLPVYVELERPFYEHIPDYTYDEVADRISCMDKGIDITFNPRVKAFIDYFAIRDREYTRMVIQRMNVYFPLFEKYLKKHNMPDDLKYLSIVESGLNPTAISHAGAAGLWQFMPATGRIFRLDRSWFIDERMDPEKATEAACKYLKQLHGMFDDWELALAAYNAGPGNVRKAIRRSGYKDDFWEVYNHLPRETRSYVPQFAAITYLMNHLQEHNFHMEDHEYQYAPLVETVDMGEFISLEALEEELNLCKGEIANLNPELIRNAVPENIGDHYALKVPSQVAPSLLAMREAIYDSTREQNQQMLAYFTRNEVGSTYNREKVTYRVQRGDYLGKIAELHNVRVSDLRHWNRIQGNTIRIGQQLAVYVLPNQKASINNQLAQTDNSSKAVSIQGAKVYYVQPGDTLWDISRKHGGLSIAQIKKLNNLTSNDLKPGQKLVLTK